MRNSISLQLSGLSVLFTLLFISINPLFANNLHAASFVEQQQALVKEKTAGVIMPETINLSLAEAISRANTYHPTIKLAKTDVEIKQAEANQSLAVILPQVNFSMTGTYTNDPLMVFGTKLLQEQVTAADFNPVQLNAPEALGNWQTKIDVAQPLFQAEGLMQRKAMKSALKAQEQMFERTKEGVELEITQRYLYWVLALEAKEVVNEALKAAEQNAVDAKLLFEEGVIDKADLLAAELFVQNLKLQANHQQTSAESLADQLKQRLGFNSEEINLVPSENIDISSYDMGIAGDFESNPENRADIKALKHVLSAQNSMYKATKARFLPSIAAFGSYQWNDEASLLGQGENFTVGVQAKVPLFKGGQNLGASQKQRVMVKQAQIQLADTERKAINEFRESERNVELAKKQWALSKLGQEQAAEAYRIKKDRHQEGLVRSFELIQSQTNLLTQRLGFLKAGFDMQLAQKKLEFTAK